MPQTLNSIGSRDASLRSFLDNWTFAGPSSVDALIAWVDAWARDQWQSIPQALQSLDAMSGAFAQLARGRLLEAKNDVEGAAAAYDSFTAPSSTGPDAGEVESIRQLLLAQAEYRCGRMNDAVRSLRSAIRSTFSHTRLNRAAKLVRQLDREGSIDYKRVARIAFLGNATFDFNLPSFAATAFAAGIKCELFKGDFDQVHQNILVPDSPLAQFKPEFIFLASNWHSLNMPEEVPDREAFVHANISRIAALWQACRDRFDAFVVAHNFAVPELAAYGRLSDSLPAGRNRTIRALNLALADLANTERNVAVVDVEHIASIVGKGRWEDPRLWTIAKQYPAPPGAPLLARTQVGLLRAAMGLSAKCVVLDLDNTLWGGIIGEDGLNGIRLGGNAEGEAFVEFQRHLKGLQQRGIILAVCSKNNESDAKLPFEKHPLMVLRLPDIAFFVASWDSKDRGLREIAAQLNIGLDSLVFVDDNPAERALVRRLVPEIEVPEVGSDPSRYACILAQTLSFESLRLTEEDRLRGGTYRTALERRELQRTAGDLDSYLTELRMSLEFHPFDEMRMPRVVQLIGKTNQFNLTTTRMSESQVRAYLKNPDAYAVCVDVQDRFTNHGLTGVLMASRRADEFIIEQWLMSCRILGRHIEDAMLASVWNFAKAAGARYLCGEYIPTAKNSQVSELYDRFGFDCVSVEQGKKRYRIQISDSREFPRYFAVSEFIGELTH